MLRHDERWLKTDLKILPGELDAFSYPIEINYGVYHQYHARE